MFIRIIKALSYALVGLKLVWREELSFRLEILCALIVAAFGFIFQISPFEFALIVLASGAVLAAETFNTALEELCDKFQPDHDPHIAKIKDLSAAAVLLTSAGAFFLGLIIFLPHIV